MATDFKTRSKFFANSKPTQSLLHKSLFVTLSEAKGLAIIRKDELLRGVYPERKSKILRVAQNDKPKDSE